MDKIFKALADKNRRKILTVLKNGEMSVSEILVNFEITQATLSNHLSILKKANLVLCSIRGKQRIYRLNKEILATFGQNISNFVGILEKTFTQDLGLRNKN
ncbi:MAG: metalloregulator ArsR/SmtB family transcription factor [Candidatus Shapirobacteria bacterium]